MPSFELRKLALLFILLCVAYMPRRSYSLVAPPKKCSDNSDCTNRGPCVVGFCNTKTSTCQHKSLEDGDSCFGFEDLNVYWETQCTPTCQEQTCVVETLNCPAISCTEHLDIAIVTQRGLSKHLSPLANFIGNVTDRLYPSGRARIAFLNFEEKSANLVQRFAPPATPDLRPLVDGEPVESSINVALEITATYFENYSRSNARRIAFLFFHCEYLLDEVLESHSHLGVEVFAFAMSEDSDASCPNVDSALSVPLVKHSFRLSNTKDYTEALPELIDDSCHLEYKAKRQIVTPDCVNNPSDVCCNGTQVITCPLSPCGETQVCESGVGCQVDVPLDCSFMSDQCNNGVCDPTNPGTCITVPAQDGTSCEDGDECTELDTCQGGTCQSGFRMDCSCMEDSDVDPCVEASCVGGLCQMVNLPDNTSCIDINNMGQPASCVDGFCAPICGNGILDDGEVCDDQLCCTSTCDGFQNQGMRCNLTSCFQSFCNNGVCADSTIPLNSGITCAGSGCCDGSGNCGSCRKRSAFGMTLTDAQKPSAKKTETPDKDSDDDDFSFDSYEDATQID